MSTSKHIVTLVAGAVAVAVIGASLILRGQFTIEGAHAHTNRTADTRTAVAKPIRNVMVQPFSTTAEAAPSEPLSQGSVSPAARDASVSTDVTDGLSLSRQRWQRGGYGSQALLTFTVSNRNAFAVKDIQLSCAFSTPDGSFTTSRTRVIRDTIQKGRKRFEHTLVGFVTAQVSDARCEVLGASRA